MKFMSAFISHSLLPAKREGAFQVANDVSSVTQTEPIATSQESVLKGFSLNENEQDTSFVAGHEVTELLNSSPKHRLNKHQEGSQLTTPLPEIVQSQDVNPLMATLQGVESTNTSEPLHFTLSESIKQTKATSPNDLHKAKAQGESQNNNTVSGISNMANDMHPSFKKIGKSGVVGFVSTEMESQLETKNGSQSAAPAQQQGNYQQQDNSQVKPLATKQKKGNAQSDNKSIIAESTENIIEPIQAEPVLTASETKEESLYIESALHSAKNQGSGQLTGSSADEAPQVRIGQVNVVIDDRHSKAKNNNVPNTGKAVNSFGLRGL